MTRAVIPARDHLDFRETGVGVTALELLLKSVLAIVGECECSCASRFLKALAYPPEGPPSRLFLADG